MVRGLDKETSFEEFLLVIKAVEKRPGLYHRFNSINSPEARFEAWNEVAKETNLPAITCRERWRYARQVFVKHMRKENVGKAGNNLIKHLHFLKSHIILKKPPTTKKPKHKIKKIENNVELLDDAESELKNVTMEAVEFLHNYDENNDDALDNMKMEQSDIEYPDDDVQLNNDSDPSLPEYSDPVPSYAYDKQQSTKDDIDLSFLKSMLPEMKLMSDRQKTIFKSKVMAVAIDLLYGDETNK